jgi:hypothetical protein
MTADFTKLELPNIYHQNMHVNVYQGLSFRFRSYYFIKKETSFKSSFGLFTKKNLSVSPAMKNGD